MEPENNVLQILAATDLPKQRKNRRQIHLFDTPEFQAKLKRSIEENLEKITQEEGFVFPTNIPLKDLISPCKRTSGKKGKVTRPQNAFILYRKDLQTRIRNENPNADFKDISKIAGIWWKSESYQIKNNYTILSTLCALVHQDLFPNYKYQPKPKENERYPKPWEPMPQIFKHTPGILQKGPLSTIPSTEIKFYEDTSASSHIIQIQQDNSAEPEYYDTTDSTSTDYITLKCENEPSSENNIIMMNYFDDNTMNTSTLSFDGNQHESTPEDSSNEELNEFLPTTSIFPFEMQPELYYSSIDDSHIYNDQLTTLPSFNDQGSVNDINDLNALYENDSLQAYNMEFLNAWPNEQLINSLTNVNK
ncbi:3516_t:CDS:2 [Funneliformis caledonium]|uniref:3516_t:CDS:1 n=1 Tax=Funneliformis caledonium TaxID=1117310 RepID=A0A9N9FTC1_9GLOM|nr:3516_t:CDS:2 [Funneliformis caledonium]